MCIVSSDLFEKKESLRPTHPPSPTNPPIPSHVKNKQLKVGNNRFLSVLSASVDSSCHLFHLLWYTLTSLGRGNWTKLFYLPVIYCLCVPADHLQRTKVLQGKEIFKIIMELFGNAQTFGKIKEIWQCTWRVFLKDCNQIHSLYTFLYHDLITN